MRLDYDVDADVLTMILSNTSPVYGDDSHSDLVVHIADDGKITMIELQQASLRISPEELVANSPDSLVSLKEAGKFVNLSPGTLRNYCEKGTIRGLKVGRNWLTTRSWLQSYVDRPSRRRKAPSHASP